MIISKYQKLFGVGPTAMLIGAAMLGLLWLLDSVFHYGVKSRLDLLHLMPLLVSLNLSELLG